MNAETGKRMILGGLILLVIAYMIKRIGKFQSASVTEAGKLLVTDEIPRLIGNTGKEI